MKKAILTILVLCFLSVSVYPIDEATFQRQLEQKLTKIKKGTPVFIKHWDGTEFYVTFVGYSKDQPDVILVRAWGWTLPMEKVLIEEIKEERK